MIDLLFPKVAALFSDFGAYARSDFQPFLLPPRNVPRPHCTGCGSGSRARFARELVRNGETSAEAV
jgi:hypothetical protein